MYDKFINDKGVLEAWVEAPTSFLNFKATSDVNGTPMTLSLGQAMIYREFSRSGGKVVFMMKSIYHSGKTGGCSVDGLDQLNALFSPYGLGVDAWLTKEEKIALVSSTNNEYT